MAKISPFSYHNTLSLELDKKIVHALILKLEQELAIHKEDHVNDEIKSLIGKIDKIKSQLKSFEKRVNTNIYLKDTEFSHSGFEKSMQVAKKQLNDKIYKLEEKRDLIGKLKGYKENVQPYLMYSRTKNEFNSLKLVKQ